MSVRDEVFAQWGPFLMEALFHMWLEELNEIRVSLGKQPRTVAYILGKCHNNLNHLDDFDWMNEEGHVTGQT